MYVNYEHACTPDQYAVVCQHHGPILCVACPGSGKTHTLVHRTAHMIQYGIAPENILLVSFTKKASHEITDRIVKLIGPDARGIWAGTFHSIALRILRKHYALLGFDTPFSVMSQGDMTDLMRLIRSEAKEVMKGMLTVDNFDGVIVDSDVKLPNANELLTFFSAVRNRCEDMKEQMTKIYTGYENVMLWIYDEYVARKRRMCLMDYDDLLFGLRYVLETKPALRATYSKKFQYIMVDEFQDTNPLQNDIVLMLTDQHQNLMVVGDEAQSIYAFRGADISNILTITEHFPNMTIMRLEENHRSHQHIVNLLNTTLDHAVEKIDKTMRAVINTDCPPPIVCASHSGLGQAEYVTGKIDELHKSGVPYHDIAVLFRNSYHANIVDMSLAQQGVPFVRWGGIKFTEAAHVLDVLAFLKIRINQFDRISWRRVLTMIPGIGTRAAEKVFETIIPQETTDDDNPLTPSLLLETRPQIQTSWEVLRNFQGTSKYTPALRELGIVLTNLDVQGTVDKSFDLIWDYYELFCRRMYAKDFEFRRHGVAQLREIASQYESVSEFLDEFATEDTEMDALRDDAVEGRKVEDKLVLSTIHSAKGCEWQHVFVIELVEGALPSYRNPDDEEELRLFYVACSRAKIGLYLVYPKERKTQDGRTERTVPSRFVRRVVEGLPNKKK